MKMMVVARDTYDEGSHRLNQSFYQFGQTMGFLPKLCQPYRPQTKGKVERMVCFVRDNFYRPLSTQLKAINIILDVETANIKGRQWLDKISNERIHDTTKEKPISRLIKERTYLQALPTQLLSVPKSITTEEIISPSTYGLDNNPLHRELSFYDQLTGA
jgi:hypothetical protein